MAETDKIPHHVAIIMDGNGRWAKSRGQERLYGHMQGVESVRNVLMAARRAGVRHLTLFVFSTENWGRPRDEVSGLMELLCKSIAGEVDSLIENGVRVRIIGDKSSVPESVVPYLESIEGRTSGCHEISLNLAINYGSREEMIHAVKKIAAIVSSGEFPIEEIDHKVISNNLYTAGIPDPDLLIRTSGELRLSNFLLWQTAYTELYFTDVYWPDFGEEEFAKALAQYALRERRYGLVDNKKP
ncbi:MAG: isoprenyl transferase [Rikenellaceae bacterium]|nr:isoprenyl transferase [Rikenellaceae bacterium]